jgi:hypothetical protein
VNTTLQSKFRDAFTEYGIPIPPAIRILYNEGTFTLLDDSRDAVFQSMLKAEQEISQHLGQVFDSMRNERQAALCNALRALTSGRRSPTINAFLQEFEGVQAAVQISMWFDGNQLEIQEYSNEGWVALKTEDAFIAAW